MKVILTAEQQAREIKRAQAAIDYYKGDNRKREYMKEAYKQLNNAKRGYLVF